MRGGGEGGGGCNSCWVLVCHYSIKLPHSKNIYVYDVDDDDDDDCNCKCKCKLDATSNGTDTIQYRIYINI